jgi:hypothetical protein
MRSASLIGNRNERMPKQQLHQNYTSWTTVDKRSGRHLRDISGQEPICGNPSAKNPADQKPACRLA